MDTKVLTLMECTEERPGQLERVKFFERMLLSVDDMVTESEYYREKLKRHNRYLHGTGIVCGLEVTPSPTTEAPMRVQISGGYALGPFGDEIFVGEPGVFLDLAKCGPGAATDPCEPSIIRGGNGVGATIIVAIKFAECQARPVRAMPAGCACEEEDCQYSRIRDSFQISCLDHLPPMPDRPSLCDVIHGKTVLTCPPAPAEPWVPLARVTLPSGGNSMKIENNDRRYIFSTQLIQDRLIICCCGEAPPPPRLFLKVKNVRFLKVDPANPSAPAVGPVLDMSSPPQNPSQPLISSSIREMNAIEVVFIGPDVDLSTVNLTTFNVKDPTGDLPGTIVKTNLPQNTVRWVLPQPSGVIFEGPPPDVRFKRATQYTLTLSGTGTSTIASIAGDALDGEHNQFPSGNDQVGGDFVLKFKASQ